MGVTEAFSVQTKSGQYTSLECVPKENLNVAKSASRGRERSNYF